MCSTVEKVSVCIIGDAAPLLQTPYCALNALQEQLNHEHEIDTVTDHDPVLPDVSLEIELDRDIQLTTDEPLGVGAFGSVFSGLYLGHMVAVKFANKSAVGGLASKEALETLQQVGTGNTQHLSDSQIRPERQANRALLSYGVQTILRLRSRQAWLWVLHCICRRCASCPV